MKNEKGVSLSEFLSKLEEREPTDNMLLWMQYYQKPCKKICCHSTDCGSIRCSSCGKYLTGNPPKARFQCIECEILPPEKINNRPELCEGCFNNDTTLHNHKIWLKVDEKGNHSFYARKHGLAELKELRISDFIVIKDLSQKEKVCTICADNFSENNPAVYYPGCLQSHGAAVIDKKLGFIDLKEFSHAECLLNWYKFHGRNFYCGDLNYCDLCSFISEKKSWEIHFKKAKEAIFEMFENHRDEIEIIDYVRDNLAISIRKDNIKKEDLNLFLKCELVKLHPQEWLRKIIMDVFKD